MEPSAATNKKKLTDAEKYKMLVSQLYIFKGIYKSLTEADRANPALEHALCVLSNLTYMIEHIDEI